MSELEDKLGAILGNQDAMGQIMSLAKSLGGNGSGGGEPAGAEGAPEEPVEASAAAILPAAEPLGGDLFSLLGNLDPKLIRTALSLFSEYSQGDDRKVALLTALRPFVKESRYAKVDRAVQIAKLSRLIRMGFELLKKEGGKDV